MSYATSFQVVPGQPFRLDAIDPGDTQGYKKSADVLGEIEHYTRRMRELQYHLYAEGKQGLLICLQALDAGGKDGVIRHVLGYMNPQGCRVQAFKVPTEKERAHDFLWRIHRAVPASGEVAIFNRSHYEDVLVARVHELVPSHVWRSRYERINQFEQQLRDSGTRVIKFFLHISKEEQLKRFHKRLEDPARWWKISESDYSERDYWDDYQQAFEDALKQCSTEQAPWYVIPADHKWYRNLVVSRIIVEEMEAMQLRLPEPTVDIEAIRKRYHQEKNHGD